MNTLVLYDSNFGNTKSIAEEIAINTVSGGKIKSAKDFRISDLNDVEVLIVGSPINGWRPTVQMLSVLAELRDLKGLKFATFDTRMSVFFHGDAKDKMAKILKAAGAVEIIAPMAFYVKGKKGPIADGERVKAAKWALDISGSVMQSSIEID